MKRHWMRRMGDTIDKTMAKGEDLQADIGKPLSWWLIAALVAGAMAVIWLLAEPAEARLPGLCTAPPYCNPNEG